MILHYEYGILDNFYRKLSIPEAQAILGLGTPISVYDAP